MGTIEMSIPYPSDILGPPLREFWTAYGDSVILPLFVWIMGVLIVAGLIIEVIYFIGVINRMYHGPEHYTAAETKLFFDACRELRANAEAEKMAERREFNG